jgi:hypothetical protein
MTVLTVRNYRKKRKGSVGALPLPRKDSPMTSVMPILFLEL